ncbi:Omp28-related outer membrane protein [bacterium SCSIO 12643]|nr:Omp28-related outer membrane protein [bacterium SCSIO 12643]
MKKRIFGYSFLLLTITYSCNLITQPYNNNGARPGDEQYNDTVYNDTTVVKRRIMLEEFTGHKCPNCPEGADIAKQIKTDHPEDFISVAIHNGSFAKVDMSDPEHPFPSDFETKTGEKLLIKYKISGFPGGLLNRTEISGAVKVDYQKWSEEVNKLIADQTYMAPRFELQLENIYNSKPGDRSLRVRYKATCLQNVTGNIAIVGYLLENKIIAPQKDSRLNDPYVKDYEHNHVLRVGFPGGGDGKTIFTDPSMGDVAEVISPADEISVKINDNWKPENMDVVVFLYNSDTGEVLQVEEIHLTSK